MSVEGYLYEYDPSGQSPANIKRDERHTLTPLNDDNYHVIVPEQAPFYRDGFILVHEETNRVLVLGTDYIFTHRYSRFEEMIGSDPYGSVTILDKELSGPVVIESYQVVGGPHVIEGRELLAALGTLLSFPDTRSMEDVIGLPDTFPPSAHVVSGEDLTNLTHVINELQNIRAAITGEYQANHLHTVEDIIGLQDRLNQVASNVGNHKHAPVKGMNVLNHVGEVGILIPQFQIDTDVLIKVTVLSTTEEPTHYEFSGRVASRFDSTPGGSWLKAQGRYEGHRLSSVARFTYDSQNRPTIYIGDETEFVNNHFVITSTTINTSVPQNYTVGWGVYVANDVTGEITVLRSGGAGELAEIVIDKLIFNSLAEEAVFTTN